MQDRPSSFIPFCRSFVKAVETAYVDAGFSVENVFLSHRFSASAVVRQRRAEGAKAIVYLDKYGQRHDVINMSSFYDSTRITGLFSKCALTNTIKRLV